MTVTPCHSCGSRSLDSRFRGDGGEGSIKSLSSRIRTGDGKEGYDLRFAPFGELIDVSARKFRNHNPKETEMLAETTINELIEKGWGIAGRDVDGAGFLSWKSHALGCLASHFGPHHAYLQYFESFVRTPEKMSILAGAGILVAAKEQMSKCRLARIKQAGYGLAEIDDLGVVLG
jgi:hypothetical protein